MSTQTFDKITAGQTFTKTSYYGDATYVAVEDAIKDQFSISTAGMKVLAVASDGEEVYVLSHSYELVGI